MGTPAMRLGGALLLLSSLTACAKPEPPQVTPKGAKVSAVGPQGITVQVDVEVVNPNRVALTVQSFTGTAKLDGRWDLGTVTVAKPTTLPSKTPVMIAVPLAMPWTDLTTLVTLAASPKPVPYAVQGTAKVGGENLTFDVPFAVTGTITREQLAAAAGASVPGGIPAIPGLTTP